MMSSDDTMPHDDYHVPYDSKYDAASLFDFGLVHAQADQAEMGSGMMSSGSALPTDINYAAYDSKYDPTNLFDFDSHHYGQNDMGSMMMSSTMMSDVPAVPDTHHYSFDGDISNDDDSEEDTQGSMASDSMTSETMASDETHPHSHEDLNFLFNYIQDRFNGDHGDYGFAPSHGYGYG